MVVAAVVVIVSMTTGGRDLPPTRARVYTDHSACLLTGSLGLADPAVVPVWAGMQDASTTTHATVSYLAVAGPATPGNALSYATTLAQRHCGTVVAVGKPQVEAVTTMAPNYPDMHVVVVSATAPGGTVITIPDAPANELRAAVAAAVQQFSKGD